ncbi:MAG: hypothetical protein SNG38_09155 [Rikenellaceae bacterium]
MKKYILILTAIVVSMVSCAKEDLNSSMDEMRVQLQLATTESSATRADGDTRYVVEAYYDETFTTPASVFENGYASSVEVYTSVVDMIISPSKEYHFLLWADNGESYNVEDLTNVSIKDGEQLTEAWQGTLAIENGSSSLYSTTLKRAVAKIILVESEVFTSKSLSVTYDSYTAFNIAIGSSVGEISTFNYLYEFDQDVTGALNAEDPIYAFAPVTYSNVVDFDFGTFSATNIPIQANYITTISGHYGSSDSYIVFDIVEDWDDSADADEEADLVTINSIDELMRYAKMDNINAKMTPGTYEFTYEMAQEYGVYTDEYVSIVTAMPFEGSNSTYDFTDVRFEIQTDVMTAFGSVDGYTIQVCGSNNTLKNLELEFIGDTRPTKGNTVLTVDGSNNIIDGFNMIVRGSYPYGYGDLFGKGSTYTIKFYKNCGINMRGEDCQLINTDLYQYAFGHAIHCQGSQDVLIQNCNVYSESRSTDDLLAEAGTGTAADNIDFMTDWGYTVPAGYMFSCCEEGFRAYNTGHVWGTDGSRNTSGIQVIDCTANNVRGGFVVHFASSTKYVENCTANYCETGFGIGDGEAVNVRGDSNYGLLLVIPYATNKNSVVDLEILPCDDVYGYHDILAYIAGSNHNYTFTEAATSKQDYHDSVEILFGGQRRGMRYDAEAGVTSYLAATGITLNNQTYYPIAFGDNSTSNIVTTKGSYTDEGTNNSVTVIE